MNILIFSHGVPSKEDPQWGCFELDQAKALEVLGHKVTIMAVDGRFRRGRSCRGIAYSEFGQIHAYLYYLFPWKLLVLQSLRRKVRSWMTKRLFTHVCGKEGAPDVIYAHYLFSMGGLDGVHSQYPDIPIVGVEHWSKLTKSKLSVLELAYAKTGYNLTDRLLAVSPSLQAQIKKHSGKDSEVVYDMVDELFLKEELSIGPGADAPFVFASCGSLIPSKGFDILLKAFAKTEDKASHLIVLGTGPEKAHLQELTETLGISSRVDFRGMVSREEIAEVYHRSSAYVLATRAETFGVSYIEAMAMGLPVIATRCGGPEHFVTDQCGYLLEVNDEEGLISAMNSIRKDHSRFNPAEIREYVRSRFSGEEIAKQLERIFEEEIQKKKQ